MSSNKIYNTSLLIFRHRDVSLIVLASTSAMREYTHKRSVTKMHMLICMCYEACEDEIKNEKVKKYLGVTRGR